MRVLTIFIHIHMVVFVFFNKSSDMEFSCRVGSGAPCWLKAVWASPLPVAEILKCSLVCLFVFLQTPTASDLPQRTFWVFSKVFFYPSVWLWTDQSTMMSSQDFVVFLRKRSVFFPPLARVTVPSHTTRQYLVNELLSSLGCCDQLTERLQSRRSQTWGCTDSSSIKI